MSLIFDFLVFLSIALSALISAVRGVTREFLLVVPWGLAVLSSLLWYDSIAFEGLRNIVDSFLVPLFDEEISSIIGSLGIFIIVLTATSILIKKIMVVLLFSAHVGAIDRILGFLFGVGRGMIIVMFLILVFDAVVGQEAPLWLYGSYSYEPLLANASSMAVFLGEFLGNEPLSDYDIKPEIPDELIIKKDQFEDSEYL